MVSGMNRKRFIRAFASISIGVWMGCGSVADPTNAMRPPDLDMSGDEVGIDLGRVSHDLAVTHQDPPPDMLNGPLDLGEPPDLSDFHSVCPTVGSIRWRVGVTNDGLGNVVIDLNEHDASGYETARLPIFKGTLAALGPLPWKTTIGCAGPAVCEPFGWIQRGATQLSPRSGTISVDSVTSPLSSEIKATLTDMVWNTISCAPFDGGCVQSFVDGQACPSLAFESVDTTVAIGKACNDVGDCGTDGKACDVASRSCVVSGCAMNLDCGAEMACVVQRAAHNNIDDGITASACYRACTPTTSGGCGANAKCVRNFSLLPTVGEWICLPQGSGAAGNACSPAAGTNSTGCTAGLACTPFFDPSGSPFGGRTCAQRCDPYADVPGCPLGQRCDGSTCGPPRTKRADAAALGLPCMQTSYGFACADDGKAYRGVCAFENLADPMPKLVCRARCELGTTCPSGACEVAGIGQTLCPLSSS